MVSSDIWMGSGATVSMIPEQNINLGVFKNFIKIVFKVISYIQNKL